MVTCYDAPWRLQPRCLMHLAVYDSGAPHTAPDSHAAGAAYSGCINKSALVRRLTFPTPRKRPVRCQREPRGADRGQRFRARPPWRNSSRLSGRQQFAWPPWRCTSREATVRDSLRCVRVELDSSRHYELDTSSVPMAPAPKSPPNQQQQLRFHKQSSSSYSAAAGLLITACLCKLLCRIYVNGRQRLVEEE